MNEIEYSYSILKYRHDASAGEALNVGIVIYSPETGQIGVLYDHRYSRLSQAFANFNGDLFKKVLGRLQAALENIGTPLNEGLFQMEARDKIKDVASLIRLAWPDQGLSYFNGPVGFGVTEDIEKERDELFDRFVLSQFDRRAGQARLDDEQLWEQFKKSLSQRGLIQHLRPVTIADVEFEHAYKNERWHVFEPLSLDYLDGDGMKKRAFEFAGKAANVRDVEDFGSLTILLGGPRRSGSSRQYEIAKRILRGAPGNPKVVEESDAETFAANLEQEMRAHKVIE